MKPIQIILLLIVTILLAAILLVRPSLAQEGLVCESDVIVQDGDWLSTIAEEAYGDPTLYDAIAFATNLKAQSDSTYAVIGSHDVIEPGWKLCLPAQTVAEELEVIAPVDLSVLTVEELINATYSGIGIFEEPVTLTEGRYEGVSEDFPDPFIVEYINGSERYGDLNGDGAEDAVVFLTESSGGTGNFIHVAAQLNQDGQPVDAGAVWIEDRIQVKSVAIENGQIMLEITAEGPGDAACCKTHLTTKTYALQDGQLAEIPGEEAPLERVSAADLNGTSWTLLELSQDQPALTETEVTITFADGQITGSGGCNTYNSGFTLADDNPFVISISPVVATRQACPQPIMDQETAYFAALENASLWGYDIERLGINYYKDEQSPPSSLLFVPADSGEASPVERLTGSTWQWVRFTDPLQQFDVENPENYTVTFQPDGTLQIQADCNSALATYAAAEEGSLTVQPGPTTLALCPGESRGEEFVQKLGFAAIYFFQDGNLFIDMMADGGTMEFSPQ